MYVSPSSPLRFTKCFILINFKLDDTKINKISEPPPFAVNFELDTLTLQAVRSLLKTDKAMKVRIKKLNDKAVIPFKKHDDDFCYDLVATSCEEVAPNVYKYGTGIALQVDEQVAKVAHTVERVSGFTIRPRSSVWKTGMVLSNSLGTIDEGFIGEISAVFYHVMPNMPRYQVGDRIAQLHYDGTPSLEFEEADELTETDRGEGGYGSTGK